MRFDSGYESGDEISQYYDNLVGKLIVWGRNREVCISRTIRALDELVIEGVATTIPADLAILRHPDFAAVEHSTKWVEEMLDLSGVPPRGRSRRPPTDGDDEPPLVQRTTTVEVNGKRFDVKMWVPETVGVGVGTGQGARRSGRASGGAPAVPDRAR